MGHYWKFVNIDRKEQLFTNDGTQLHQILEEGALEQLVDLLRSPNWIPFRGYATRPKASESSRSPLFGLPQEVIDMIISNLAKDSPESMIYLSMTCVYFFRLLGQDCQRKLADDGAPWAGDRLVFVGEYANGLDIRGICTTDELREFEDKYGDNPFFWMPEGAMYGREYRAEAEEDLPFTQDDFEVRQAGALEQRVRDKLTSDDLDLFDRLAPILRRPQRNVDDHKKNIPVLRNLTAKKYVRDDTIAESDYAYSLGEVVGVLTTWTVDGSDLSNLEAEGEWAGHRIDIATMADVSEEEWTDVSQMAIEALRTGIDESKDNGKRA